MKTFLAVLLAVFFSVGCAPVSVEHQGQLPQQDKQVKATYSWLQSGVPSNDIRVNNPTIDAMVRQSVERRLGEKGYKKVENGNADYLLAWFGTIDEEVKEISLASFYNRGGYAGLLGRMPEEKPENGKVRKVFSRGTLIIDVLDRQDKEVLWRGSATNTLQEDMTKGRIASYIDTSVAKILEKLP